MVALAAVAVAVAAAAAVPNVAVDADFVVDLMARD